MPYVILHHEYYRNTILYINIYDFIIKYTYVCVKLHAANIYTSKYYLVYKSQIYVYIESLWCVNLKFISRPTFSMSIILINLPLLWHHTFFLHIQYKNTHYTYKYRYIKCWIVLVVVIDCYCLSCFYSIMVCFFLSTYIISISYIHIQWK